uniref:Uncharacterized protein n=1 Tax=Anopheles coluzzii TaxID=1518534 RepID=A0A8W7P716_ANOCL
LWSWETTAKGAYRLIEPEGETMPESLDAAGHGLGDTAAGAAHRRPSWERARREDENIGRNCIYCKQPKVQRAAGSRVGRRKHAKPHSLHSCRLYCGVMKEGFVCRLSPRRLPFRARPLGGREHIYTFFYPSIHRQSATLPLLLARRAIPTHSVAFMSQANKTYKRASFSPFSLSPSTYTLAADTYRVWGKRDSSSRM